MDTVIPISFFRYSFSFAMDSDQCGNNSHFRMWTHSHGHGWFHSQITQHRFLNTRKPSMYYRNHNKEATTPLFIFFFPSAILTFRNIMRSVVKLLFQKRRFPLHSGREYNAVTTQQKMPHHAPFTTYAPACRLTVKPIGSELQPVHSTAAKTKTNGV